jgi:hypothetical protein
MVVRAVQHFLVIVGKNLSEMPFFAIDKPHGSLADVPVEPSLLHPDVQRLVPVQAIA